MLTLCRNCASEMRMSSPPGVRPDGPFRHIRWTPDLLDRGDGELCPRVRVFAQTKSLDGRSVKDGEPQTGKEPGEGQLAVLRGGVGSPPWRSLSTPFIRSDAWFWCGVRGEPCGASHSCGTSRRTSVCGSLRTRRAKRFCCLKARLAATEPSSLYCHAARRELPLDLGGLPVRLKQPRCI
jgi:hypothetical protein